MRASLLFVALMLASDCGAYRAGAQIIPARPLPCGSPTRPALAPSGHDAVALRYVIRVDGTVRRESVEILAKPTQVASYDLMEAAVDWLSACRFEPATSGGADVPTSVVETITFPPGAELPPPSVPLAGQAAKGAAPDETGAKSGAGMTRPAPSASCGPFKMPREAMLQENVGRVVLRYVVQADGSADPHRIVIMTDAPVALVDAAAKWLLACRFTPATFDGKPVAAGIVQPFSFQL